MRLKIRILVLVVAACACCVLAGYWTTTTRERQAALSALDPEFLLAPNATSPRDPAYFIIMLVLSYVGNFERRVRMRISLSDELLANFKTKRIFVVGKIPRNLTTMTQESVRAEAARHGDVLQARSGAGAEAGAAAAALGWAARRDCSFVLVTHDHARVDLPRLHDELHAQRRRDDFHQDTFMMGTPIYVTAGVRAALGAELWGVMERRAGRAARWLAGGCWAAARGAAGRLAAAARGAPLALGDPLLTGALPDQLGLVKEHFPPGIWVPQE